MTTPAENAEPVQPKRKWYEKIKWQLILTIGIPIVFSILFSFYTQNKKELSGVLISSSSLVQVSQGAPSDIGITYKGSPVTNAAVVQIQIVNTGNQPIEEADFSKPLAIEFASDVQILDVQVSNQQPPNLGMVISQTLKNRAEIAPILINNDDSATLTLITTGAIPTLETTKLEGRLSGVKTIALKKQLPSKTRFQGLLFLLLGISSLLMELRMLSNIKREDLFPIVSKKYSSRTNILTIVFWIFVILGGIYFIGLVIYGTYLLLQ